MSAVIHDRRPEHAIPAEYEDAAQVIAIVFEQMSETMSEWANWAIEPVTSRHVSGFIPYTDGGYDMVGWQTIGGAESGCNLPKMLQPLADRIREDMERAWESERGAPFPTCDSPDDVREEAWEFEDEWMSEGCTFFYKVRAMFYGQGNTRNATGEDEILFTCGICDDLEYGRDHVGAWAGNVGTHWVWERTVPLSEFSTDLMGEIGQAMLEALRDA